MLFIFFLFKALSDACQFCINRTSELETNYCDWNVAVGCGAVDWNGDVGGGDVDWNGDVGGGDVDWNGDVGGGDVDWNADVGGGDVDWNGDGADVDWNGGIVGGDVDWKTNVGSGQLTGIGYVLRSRNDINFLHIQHISSEMKNWETASIYIYIYIYVVPPISFLTFLYWHLKLSYTLENSISYCYSSYEMTDQFLWFRLQMNS